MYTILCPYFKYTTNLATLPCEWVWRGVQEDAVQPVVDVGAGGAGETDVAYALQSVGFGVRPSHEGVVRIERGSVESHGERPADAVGVVVPDQGWGVS